MEHILSMTARAHCPQVGSNLPKPDHYKPQQAHTPHKQEVTDPNLIITSTSANSRCTNPIKRVGPDTHTHALISNIITMHHVYTSASQEVYWWIGSPSNRSPSNRSFQSLVYPMGNSTPLYPSFLKTTSWLWIMSLQQCTATGVKLHF